MRMSPFNFKLGNFTQAAFKWRARETDWNDKHQGILQSNSYGGFNMVLRYSVNTSFTVSLKHAIYGGSKSLFSITSITSDIKELSEMEKTHSSSNKDVFILGSYRNEGDMKVMPHPSIHIFKSIVWLPDSNAMSGIILCS